MDVNKHRSRSHWNTGQDKTYLAGLEGGDGSLRCAALIEGLHRCVFRSDLWNTGRLGYLQVVCVVAAHVCVVAAQVCIGRATVNKGKTNVNGGRQLDGDTAMLQVGFEVFHATSNRRCTFLQLQRLASRNQGGVKIPWCLEVGHS